MVALVVVGLVLGVRGGRSGRRDRVRLRPSAGGPSFADADAAYGACQRFAGTQLKAPGPVTFAPIRRRTVRRYADGRVLVRSHADVTNAAGRLVEIRITCTMRPLGGDRWDLEGLAVRSD